ncbi:BASS family bile acid:Na+ symporter [Parabacteroides sp. PH5-13]|uniref:bile acid:sodium symporter family protein n=2 Tax=Parabacteroides TaxID=375288 RepID=UPI002473A147|nr:bile acid:sodium symporter family protein [Parabacteroides sp. PFB2-22]MDH6304817.1 BASS family bile acid:Na+ symporter [Parabacteroides sp. PH5-39]MDH6319229.1 BASS family bile acid:Na+ symporter [Parabacteroides sp. PH5-13]MDH6322960.1 BASS family bile acid:Na+ symporter [Parabacteroides sp. PH5-8]MDH6384318.1 BASS family bile acid:Na+ symporter [Parabacteroides sp. PH5-17]MDH6406538.1 BASS family bile acid:Na+ symporter [Parabacteroides sp. PH5-26]
MKKNNFHKVLLGGALLCLIIFLIITLTAGLPSAGPFLIAFFLLLAIGVRGFEATKSFSYTIAIFTAVTASMFYPQYFTHIGSFKLSLLIVPLLQIIMFGMGSQMSLDDFTGVIKMPKGVLIGVSAQFTIMPLTALAISKLLHFPPEIAAGIILIGCAPSGLASNVMSYIARANLPLAVTIGAVATILAPFLTPLLMKLLGGQFIEVNFWSMMLDILNMIILPIVAGFIFNMFYNKKENNRKSMLIQLLVYAVIILGTNLIYLTSDTATSEQFFTALMQSVFWFFLLPIVGAIALKYILKGNRKVIEECLSFLSMAGIAVIIVIITAAGRDSLLEVGALLLLSSLLHNLIGYTLGYNFARLFKLPEKDRRTIALEVGMQNGGLASGLAMQMGKIATVGLAPAVFGPLMNITGSVLASWWRGKIPAEDLQTEQTDKQEDLHDN